MPDGDSAFAGHAAAAPLHVSAASHAPTDERQTVPDGARASLGQLAAAPVHVSAASHAPADVRQTVDAGRNPFAGHAAAAPVQLSATSQTPAPERHRTRRTKLRPGSSRRARRVARRTHPPPSGTGLRRASVRRTELRLPVHSPRRRASSRGTPPAAERRPDTRRRAGAVLGPGQGRDAAAADDRRRREGVGRTRPTFRAASGGVADASPFGTPSCSARSVRRTARRPCPSALGDVAYAGGRAGTARPTRRASAGQVVDARAGPRRRHRRPTRRHTAPRCDRVGGQLAVEPVRRSATSRPVAEAAHRRARLERVAGHVIAVPLHVSGTSHTPAAERQIACR